jgi:hypothetical protein
MANSNQPISSVPLLYPPLDNERYEIRILTILPGPAGVLVECTLQNVSLITPGKYVALSYCWGDAKVLTPITVNGAVIYVTTNLADALQHLRELGIDRVWADALCIDQSNNQEKSVQIREMTKVYSLAGQCYAYVGNEERDGSVAAMHFLQELSQQEASNFLEEASHSCSLASQSQAVVVAPTSALGGLNISLQDISNPAGIAGPQVITCQRCSNEANLRNLADLLERPYWKRRWIIQEIVVATRVQIACGSEGMTISAMKQAIERCQASCYWQSSVQDASHHFRQILTLRLSYHTNRKPTLCYAIQLTPNSLSFDARDRIYALLGMCSDGPDLVPILDYHQDIDIIVRDLTRAIIDKTMCLDVILINGLDGRSSATLPSWAPDWLNPSLPGQAYIYTFKPASALPVLLEPLSEDQKSLHVQGFEVGTITHTTSLLTYSLHPRSQGTTTPRIQPSVYYCCADGMILNILSGLLGTRLPMACSCQRKLFKWLQRLSFWACLATVYTRIKHQENQKGHDSKAVKTILLDWAKTNGSFPIHNSNIYEWSNMITQSKWLVVGAKIFSNLNTKWIKVFYNLIILGGFSLVFLFAILIVLSFQPSSPLYNQSRTPWIATSATIIFVEIAFALISRQVSRLMAETAELRSADSVSRGLEDYMLHSKRTFVTEKGFSGTAYVGAEAGDRIWILDGCTVAIVLRAVGSSSTRFTVVCEASVMLEPSWKNQDMSAHSRLATVLEEKRLQGMFQGIELI